MWTPRILHSLLYFYWSRYNLNALLLCVANMLPNMLPISHGLFFVHVWSSSIKSLTRAFFQHSDGSFLSSAFGFFRNLLLQSWISSQETWWPFFEIDLIFSPRHAIISGGCWTNRKLSIMAIDWSLTDLRPYDFGHNPHIEGSSTGIKAAILQEFTQLAIGLLCGSLPSNKTLSMGRLLFPSETDLFPLPCMRPGNPRVSSAFSARLKKN